MPLKNRALSNADLAVKISEPRAESPEIAIFGYRRRFVENRA
jgi:hypothetical protein